MSDLAQNPSTTTSPPARTNAPGLDDLPVVSLLGIALVTACAAVVMLSLGDKLLDLLVMLGTLTSALGTFVVPSALAVVIAKRGRLPGPLGWAASTLLCAATGGAIGLALTSFIDSDTLPVIGGCAGMGCSMWIVLATLMHSRRHGPRFASTR